MNQQIAEKNYEKSSDKSSETGIYYAKLADKYRIIKFSLLIFLTVFIVLMIVFGNSSMRGVQFRYLVKYLDINPTTLDSRYSDIAYAVGGGSKFAYYHDDLAVLGEGKMTLYNLAGDLKFRSDIEKGTVTADAEGKYLAAYVSGKEKLALFHSFDKVSEISFSSPISLVSVSEEGTLAVCLKENGGNSILIINDNFETDQTLAQNGGIVIDMAISNDGKTLSVLTLFGSDGSYYTRLDLWNLKKNEIVKSETFSARKPIATGFFANDRFYAILDRGICFYAINGDKANVAAFANDSFRYYTNDEQILILTSSGNLALYESNGKQRFSISVTETILDAKMVSETIYLLSESEIMLYDNEGNFLSRLNIASGALEFFILDDKSILLCYASETKRISLTE